MVGQNPIVRCLSQKKRFLPVNSKRPLATNFRRMLKVKMAEVESRLGSFSIIQIGQTVIISPCDTRTKILEALSKGPLTSERLARKIGVSYSCVMDHMDFLETLGVVKALSKRPEEGRRRIYFHLSEDPLEGIEQLFMTAPRNGRGRSTPIARAQPPVPI
jgi:DNA-binding transcriptional ArsR family regulator